VRVYIAGPMRGYEEYNYPAFNRAAERFRAFGHEVVNPVEINHGPEDPGTHPPEHYVRNDLREMAARCNAIALLPGWEASVGARCEVAVALTLGFTFYDAGSGSLRDAPYQCTISGGYGGSKDCSPYTLDELAMQALAWQAVTFTERTCSSIAAHLRREVRELVGTDEEPAIAYQPWEMADVFLLLVALANECGTDLAQAVHEKLQVNRSRTWGKPDADGVVEHVAEGVS
jgi:hypothetical protein